MWAAQRPCFTPPPGAAPPPPPDLRASAGPTPVLTTPQTDSQRGGPQLFPSPHIRPFPPQGLLRAVVNAQGQHSSPTSLGPTQRTKASTRDGLVRNP